jgi:hypothetical protein
MPQPSQAALGLLDERLERRIRTFPLCQNLLVLLPRLGSPTEPFVCGASKQANPT